MVPSMFDDLLHLVGPSLIKKTTHLREPRSAEIRLAITLRYLAAGESQASSFNYLVSRSTDCEIREIREILKPIAMNIWEILKPISTKIWEILKPIYMKIWEILKPIYYENMGNIEAHIYECMGKY